MEFDNITNPDNLLEYMSKNIKYGFVDKNGKTYINPKSKEDWGKWYKECLVQTGDQVLNTKVGTCWDQVELERIWFEKNNYEIKTIFIWFEKDDGDYPNHTFLLYKMNNKYYWFENSFEIYRGIYEYNTESDAIEDVISKHLKYAINIGVASPDDKKYIKYNEYSKLVKPLNVDEYINHVIKNEDNKKSLI